MGADRRISRLGTLWVAVLLALPGAAAAQTAIQPVVRDVAREVACGPHAAWVMPTAAIRIVGGMTPKRTLFGGDDLVLIDAGTAHGLADGQEFFVRRALRDPFVEVRRGEVAPVSVRTAGWVRVESAGERVSAARVVYACDGVLEGDYLEPFALPTVPVAAAAGEPDYSDPGRILLGDERRQTLGTGAFAVFDRGSENGVQAGQRLTVYRRPMAGGPAVVVAEAMVFSVRPHTALVRIESARDAVLVGDLAALHK